jgi:YegS/Rv2252/BmrU family lipid kinase
MKIITRQPIMQHEKIVFIVNPRAGKGITGKKWRLIRDRAKEQLGAFETFFTEEAGDAVRIARQQLKEGADLLVSVGGDGTLNETINGFMDGNAPVRKDSRLGILPCGTGCDLARTVFPSYSLDSALMTIKEGHTRHVDLGRISYFDHGQNPCIRYFHNITSFGIGGEVVAHVNESSKAMGPFLSFMRSTLVTLLRHNAKRICLKIDDGEAEEFLALNVAVANGRYHGGGMCVAPDASINDGIFHVTIIGSLALPEIFLNLPRFYNGRIKDVKNTLSFTATHIEASSKQQVRLDIDGEQPGFLPSVIDVVPRVLPLIVDRRMMQNSPFTGE